jgi:SAM-dependent methyltransferase
MTHRNNEHRHTTSPADVLDLDAQVLAEHTASITAWLPVRSNPGLIVDLGSGTGAGTFALLAQFPRARVVAVDASADHLRAVADKAERLGLADQVSVIEADLDRGWPYVGQPDLVWASASLHHLGDPHRTLRQIREVLAPNGLLAVLELADFPRFLSSDEPRARPGLEDRCHAISAQMNSAHLRHRGADWGVQLTAAGFTVEAQRTITVDVNRAKSSAVVDYAYTALTRMRAGVGSLLDPEDLAELDKLLDTDGPESILRRSDIAVRAERAVWAARAN